MTLSPCLSRICLYLSVLPGLWLAGCGSAPPAAPKPVEPAAPAPAGRDTFQVQLGDGFTLDYQVERKISALNRKSCYFFISGTLLNQSGKTLSKESVLDFIALDQGKQAYRDLSNPVSAIAPGARATFGLLSSPVYRDGCPHFERFSVSLRKVFLD